jgi:hypothetical protein
VAPICRRTFIGLNNWSIEMPRPRPTLAERIDFAALMQPVALHLLGEPNSRLSKPPADIRFGTNGSVSINSETGQFFDHEAKIGGGVLDLIKHKNGCDHASAVQWLRREGFLNGARLAPLALPKPILATQPAPKVVATYDYTDEMGALLFQAVRYEPKEFRQRRPGPNNTWIWNLDGVRRVPYRVPDMIAAVAAGKTVWIVEGEKDADNLHRLGLAATTNPMGSNKWHSEYNQFLRGADVVIIGDNDKAGHDHVEQVAASLHGVVGRIRVLDIAKNWPECPAGGDITDWLVAGGTADKLKPLIEALPNWSERPPRLQPLTLSKFFSLAIKPREMLLEPIIPEKGLAMLYASRGTGKTHIALGIGYAVATGTGFLRWKAPKPRRVLLIDGEMPAAALQERLANIVAGITEAEANPDALKILAGDLIEEGGIGNLSSPEIQAELDPWLDETDLLILDNLSSLTAVIRDNDAESWGPIQDWLLRLRRKGLSVLIVHHAGKGGQQRGTSRREDVLDTSISLRRPEDYTPAEGARFEVHLEKGRGIHGDAAKPFEAKLEVVKGSAIWTTRDIEDVNLARVKALVDDGLSVRDIADETGIPKSTVQRLKNKIAAEGKAEPETDGIDG